MKSKTILHIAALAFACATSVHAADYTWGGGTSVWTDTSATGWNAGSYPVNGDTATINSGQVSTTWNDQTYGINLNIGGGTLDSGNVYMRVESNTTLQGGTIIIGHNQAYNQGWFGGALGGTITVSGSAASSITGGTYTGQDINMGSLTTFDVNDVASGADLTVSLKLTDYYAGSWLSSSLVKNGAGTLALTANNNYAGTTTVNGGVLDLSTGIIYRYAGWGSRSITINNGGTVKVSNWGDGNADTAGGFGQIGFVAGNIVMDNGTIEYVGGAASGNMDRPFTIGAGGATLVANGSATWEITQIDGGGRELHTLASNGGSLTLSGSGNGIIGKVIPGNGGVTKTGSGTWTLSGANIYTGATTVNAGTLVVDGTLTSSSLASVGGASSSGAPTLCGSGTVNGTLTINAASGGAVGTVNPGAVAATGTLSTGAVVINGTLAIDLDASASDLLAVGGNLDISGATLTVNELAAPATTPYTIATYAGTLSGTFSNLPAGYTVNYGTGTNSSITLVKASADYDTWGAPYGLSAGSEGGDLDSDDLTNYKEYAFGLLPNNGSSVSPIAVPLDKTTGTFSYTRRLQSLTGLSYTVWYSTDLSGWFRDDGAVQGSPSVTDQVETVPVTLTSTLLTNPALFIQIRAE